PTARILLVPGRVAPWNGQLIVPEVARIMLDSAMRGFVFVLAGESRSHRKYTRAVMEQAQDQGVRSLVRQVGHCRDLPAALAVADTVAVPSIEPQALGRVVAQAQAMGRPGVASNIGVLPGHVVSPPGMPGEGRTG